MAQECGNEENVQACAFLSLETCRTDNSCANDRKQAIATQDIIEDVAGICCGKPKAGAITKCLKRQGRKARRSLRPAIITMKPFIREVNAGIKELRQNDCSTGTLGEL